MEHMAAKIEITVSTNRCWFWRLVAHNGETLASSEMYSRKAECKRTAKAVAKQLKVAVVES